jgi:type I restriction enzyme S subunit
MKEQTVSNVPQIRFKGFDGEWEEKTFDQNILSIQTGTNLLGSITGKGAPLLKMGNIQRGSFSFERLECLDRDAKVEAENIAHFGDFLFNTRNTLDLVGKGATWMGESGKFAFNGNLARFKFQGINTVFFNYLYNTSSLVVQVKARAMGTTSVAAIYPKNLNSLAYSLPAPAEQTQIGKYFRELDSLIGLHQRKHDKLVTLKKAMLQKMFPQPGATTPEIRFKGFSGDWGQRSLSKLTNKVTEKNVAKKHSETFTNSAEFGIISQRDYFDKDISNAENIGGYYIVEPECFVYNPRISVLAPVGPVNRNKLGRTGIMSPLYTVFRTKDVDNTFLEYFFKTNLWHPFMFLNGDTGARADRFSIKDAVFMELPVSYPVLLEQQKIGTYFRTLDELISKHATQLQKLQQIKSACLEKMFV